ncbi:MAG: acetylglutamate kinase [Thermoplasmatota archaeon]
MELVLKLGGAVALEATQLAIVAAEVKALEGHHVTIVHGGGPQLDVALAALGEAVEKRDGLRVTSPRAAGVVLDVMNGIGRELARRLADHGIDARHVEATPGRLRAHRKSAALGRVGTADEYAGRLPAAPSVGVVTPVGFDEYGPLNVNADEAASVIAVAAHARWLVLGTDVNAVRGEGGKAMDRLSPHEARRLIETQTATGGMIPKLASAVAALEGGVQGVLVTRVAPGTLVDAVLKGRGAGTLVA